MKRWLVNAALTAALAAVMTMAMGTAAFADGWMQEGDKWWYAADDTGESWYADGWKWLDADKDGKAECYYFGADGYLVAGTRTPDGYDVTADGAWIENGVVQTWAPKGPGETMPEGNAKVVSSADGNTRGSLSAQPAAAGRYIDPAQPMVALTFDDGPQMTAGNSIMDTLAAYGGKATFFLVGDRCAARTEELKRMVAEGHEVANHTYQHKYLQNLDAQGIQYQISQGSAAIEAASGAAPALVRLPGGNNNATVVANVNYPMIQWSIDTLDWKHRDPQKTIEAVLGSVQDGDIVLMHELYNETAAAVQTIVPELVARGYQLVTVSEMAAARGVQLMPNQLYYSFRP